MNGENEIESRCKIFVFKIIAGIMGNRLSRQSLTALCFQITDLIICPTPVSERFALAETEILYLELDTSQTCKNSA